MNNLLTKSVIDRIEASEKLLNEALATGEVISNNIIAQALQGVFAGIRLNMSRHDDCEVLSAYRLMMTRIAPVVITALLLGIIGGLLYAREVGVRIP